MGFNNDGRRNGQYNKNTRGNGNYHNQLENAKKQIKKAKPEPTIFTKTYTDFEYGIQDVYTICEYLKELFENAISIGDVYERLVDIIAANVPNPETRTNILWEATISGNKCSIKTNNWVTLAWNIRSVREEDGTYNISYTFTLTYLNKVSEEDKEAMKEAGWNIVVPYKKPTRPNFNNNIK